MYKRTCWGRHRLMQEDITPRNVVEPNLFLGDPTVVLGLIQLNSCLLAISGLESLPTLSIIKLYNFSMLK